MADNVSVTAGAGTTILADELNDGTLGTGKVQYVKLMDGTLDSSNKLSISGGGAAKVDGSAVTQPVSAASLPLPAGAATASAQTTANASLSSLDTKLPAQGQALAAASVPVVLPVAQVTALTPPAAITGFATAAKQPALGTAGSASADVLSVQGVASMTPLKTDSSATTQPVSAASLPLPTGASTGAAQTTANTSLSSIDGKVPALGQALAAASVPVVLTAAQITALTPPAAISGFALDATLTGGTQKSKLVDSAGTNAASVSAGGALKVDNSAVTQPVSGTFWQTTQPVSLTSTTVTGTVAVTESGTWTVQPGNTANTTPWLTSQRPATAGGLSIYRALAAATTNAASVKASAGQVYGWYLYNASASAKFVKIYNKVSSPTVGTDVPVMTIPLPATAGANVFTDSGIAFATGIAIAITGGIADADTTALAANDVVVNLLYS